MSSERSFTWHSWVMPHPGTSLNDYVYRTTQVFQESELFICKAFMGDAVRQYCEPMITRQLGNSGF